MNDAGGAFGAVLVIRIWFEAYPSPANLRARILHADDPARAEADSVVVAGVERTTEVFASWLAGYVAECERLSSG